MPDFAAQTHLPEKGMQFALSPSTKARKEGTMTQAAMAFYRQRLLALLARLTRDESQLREEALQPTGGEASGGLSDIPVHPADLGSLDSEEDVAFTLLENEEELIEEINLALARIEQGTFGRCEGCRKDIPQKRLRVLPYTRFCVGCAETSRQTVGP
jgi:RNA polymerase-binding transcription factor DksA